MLMSVAMSNDIMKMPLRRGGRNKLPNLYTCLRKINIISFCFEWSLIVVVGEFVFEDDR